MRTIRWNFPWRSRVVVGVPDGITDRFVYEFKATKNKYIALFRKPVALVQADLYGMFFRRPEKRVQIHIFESGETLTWQEHVDVKAAEAVLQKFEAVDETRKFPAPKPWKCKRCEYRGKLCASTPEKNGTIILSLPNLVDLQLRLILDTDSATVNIEAHPARPIPEEVIERNVRYWRSREVLTLLKVLRESILFHKREDFRKFRFFLGLVRRELRYLRERLPSDIVSGVENVLKNAERARVAELENMESNVRAAALAYLKSFLAPEEFNEFVERLTKQDSQVERKILRLAVAERRS